MCRFMEMALEAEFSARRTDDPFLRHGYLQAARSFRTLAAARSGVSRQAPAARTA